jgi:ssDNA thymidine ADP-ribosyltransferase, DarT
MVLVPSNPKIYHITHIANLPNIAASMGLVSDANRIASGLSCSLVGMSTIKQRRLDEIEVSCHSGTTVGQYVPFYFCPRSIMLYILHMGNHPDVSYKGGQQPIVHLQADFNTVVHWANSNTVRWAFSNGNAGDRLTEFYNHSSKLSEIDWAAVLSTDFRDARVKKGKQAEFLMFDVFPWTLIEKIGTINSSMAAKVQTALANVGHQPVVAIEPSWYF